MTTIAEKLDTVQKDVSLIKTALLGNDAAGIPGVVKTLEKHGNRLDKLEATNKKNKMVRHGKLICRWVNWGGMWGRERLLSF